MRLSLSSLILWPLAALAATSYDKARSKSFPVKLTDTTFPNLTTGDRDYATVVLLTAIDARFACGACQVFQPEWDLLGKSWQKGDKKGESRIVFATLDFVDGRETFINMKMQHAPVLFLYPPTKGPNAKPADVEPLTYDFARSKPEAEAVRNWIAEHLPEGPKPEIQRPYNYAKAATVVISVLGVVALFTLAASVALPFIQNRNVWATISLLLVLLFTSGHMFNRIRNVPYVAGDGKGGVAYFASGFQNQYGMETQLIAAIYGVLAFAAINLAVKCPRIVDPKAQQFAVLAWSGVLFFVYGFLLNIFRWKNGGYPFFLPPW